MPRYNTRKLTDILNNEDREELARQFRDVEAAGEFEPVPAGEYEVDVVHGELCVSGHGTTGYTAHLEITEGEFRGRKIWHTLWMSEAALPYTKRDLAKLGIHNLEQCEQPVPPGIFCKVKVVVRMDNQGINRNKVTRITAGGVRKDPTVDPDFGGASSAEKNAGGAL